MDRGDVHERLRHVAAEGLPLALAEVHGSMAVGSRLRLAVVEGPLARHVADAFGHMSWDGPRLRLLDVLEGAGFTDVALRSRWRDEAVELDVSAVRDRSLADVVAPGMRLLVCGLNPSIYSADRGVGYARPGNRFWPAMTEAGLASVDRDPHRLLDRDRVGMTDLVKRATVAASELDAQEYRTGLARVERLCAWLRPAAVCFVGLAGWRAAVDRTALAGPQERSLGQTPVYVMPSTSGLNAHSRLPELVDHLRAAAAMADAAGAL